MLKYVIANKEKIIFFWLCGLTATPTIADNIDLQQVDDAIATTLNLEALDIAAAESTV